MQPFIIRNQLFYFFYNLVLLSPGRPQKLLVGSGCEEFAGPIVSEEGEERSRAQDQRKGRENTEDKETVRSKNNTVTESEPSKGNKSKESKDKDMAGDASGQMRTESKVCHFIIHQTFHGGAR